MVQDDASVGRNSRHISRFPMGLETVQRFVLKVASGSMPLFVAAGAAMVWTNWAAHSPFFIHAS